MIFTAGGGASGKNTALRVPTGSKGVNFVVDTTLSTPERAKWQISVALEVGRKVEINYVYRPFADCVRAMLRRALDPKVGRVVPIDDLARTHAGAQQTVVELFMHYVKNDETRLSILLWENAGMNRLKQMPFVMMFQLLTQTLLAPVDEPRAEGQSLLDAIYENKDSGWEGGEISAELHEAARSRTRQRANRE